jgi:hypothetical protein
MLLEPPSARLHCPRHLRAPCCPNCVRRAQAAAGGHSQVLRLLIEAGAFLGDTLEVDWRGC